MKILLLVTNHKSLAFIMIVKELKERKVFSKTFKNQHLKKQFKSILSKGVESKLTGKHTVISAMPDLQKLLVEQLIIR